MNELKTIIDGVKNELLARKHILKKHSQLYFGSIGKIMFLSNYLQYSEEENIQTELWRLIEELILQTENSVQSNYFSNGLCGLAWSLKWLENCGILEEQNELLHPIDSRLRELTLQCDHYDLMYGLIGYGVYFLESGNKEMTKNIVEKVINLSSKTKYGKIWFDTFSEYDINANSKSSNRVINIGLAHGIPSIISYLSSAYRFNPTFDLREIVLSLINTIKELTVVGGNKLFSHLYDENLHPINGYDHSKLTWTYGDVTMGFSLVKAGYTLNEKSIIDYGLQILNKTIDRSLKDSDIYQKKIISAIDTSFCNGTSGVAHLYGRLFQLTKNKEYLKKTDYWITKTLHGSLKDKRRGIYGYVSYGFDENYFLITKEIDPTLFSGVSGTALVLLEYLFSNNYLLNNSTGWDKIFLTNLD
ncbi:lanthionine synthetase LanC family protein [Aquimarina sp. AU58]|uniref:lanthionine synthetase LanC family protein n=1 Tax=Aquimarina sp. AU58 TaxID=1874112 RepID=UPI000D6DECD8|nr:lanthionine synthetase LanC family protein [Aquimarina sp. AU58]